MRFKAEPGHYVRFVSKQSQLRAKMKGFTFGADGTYETENPFIIGCLKSEFQTVEESPVEVISEPDLYPEPIGVPEPDEHEFEYKCKKCDFGTNNKGSLMAHYREHHPKED